MNGNFIFIPQAAYAPNPENQERVLESTILPPNSDWMIDANLLGETVDMQSGVPMRNVSLTPGQSTALFNIQASQMVHYPAGSGAQPGVWISIDDALAMGIITPRHLQPTITEPEIFLPPQAQPQPLAPQTIKSSPIPKPRPTNKKDQSTRGLRQKSPFTVPTLKPDGF